LRKRALFGFFFLGCLLLPASSYAQFTLVSGTVTSADGLPWANGTISATLVTPGGGSGATLNGASFNQYPGPFQMQADGSFTFRLPDNNVVQPSGTQWNFMVNIAPGILPPAGTGSQSFSSTITITGATQNIGATLNASAPKLANAVGISASSGMKAIFATDPQWAGGVKADAKSNCYAVITNSSNQLTTLTGVGGVPFTAADQGAMIEGTNGPCNAAGTTVGSVLINGFICSLGGFVNANTVNVCTTASGSTPATATGNCTSNFGTQASCPVNWGLHDDTAALQAAYNATVTSTGPCGSLILPQGRIIVKAPIVAASGSARCGTIVNNQFNLTMGYSVSGQGIGATTLVPWNNFDASTCNTGCFFSLPPANGPTEISMHDFAIDGGGVYSVTNGSGKVILYICAECNMYNLLIAEWGVNSGMYGFNLNGNQSDLGVAYNLTSYNGGANCFQAGGLFALYSIFCYDVGSSVIQNSGITYVSTYTSNFISSATAAGGGTIVVSSGGASPGVWHDHDSYVSNPGFGPAIMCGGTCVLDGTKAVGGASIAPALYMQDNGGHAGTAYISKSILSNSGFAAISGGVAGSTIYDLCGNTLIGTITSTNISFQVCPAGPTVDPAPTVSGTGACATITTQLPATVGGWTGSFKCTGTTGASTITITFPWTALNGWTLTSAYDITTVANTLHENASTTTTLVIGAATITQNDVINWSALPF
jgi:hypothetical protein